MRQVVATSLDCASSFIAEAVQSCRVDREPPVQTVRTIDMAIQLLETARDVIDFGFRPTVVGKLDE